METKLRVWSKLVGYALLLSSMILSYRGFEFNFDTTEGFWRIAFISVGILLTCAVTIIQLVFNTDFNNLNLTLKVAGVLSYIYSIYTNYKGLQPFMSLDGNDYTVWVVAVFLDAVPEPLIAWSMGESLRGDLLGNIKKWAGFEEEPKPVRRVPTIPASIPRVAPRPDRVPPKQHRDEEEYPTFHKFPPLSQKDKR